MIRLHIIITRPYPLCTACYAQILATLLDVLERVEENVNKDEGREEGTRSRCNFGQGTGTVVYPQTWLNSSLVQAHVSPPPHFDIVTVAKAPPPRRNKELGL